jgi:hypothetical protein
MSPLYGLIGRNTRVRLSVPSVGSYLQMEGDPTQTVTTPDAPALDITGDLDVRAELAPNWYGTDSQNVIGKWDAASNQRSWVVRIERGRLYFVFCGDGTKATAWSLSVALPVLPERAAVRVTFDADNGTGSREVRFYWATSLSGAWTMIGVPNVQGAASPLTIFNSSAPLSVCLFDPLANPKSPRLPFVGRGFRFEVRNGINGTIVASPDFTGLAAGTTTFTDSAGRPWTLSDTAEIRDREDRFAGEVSSWPAKWTLDGSDVWTPIQASGILRRLGQGVKALDSTLRRRIPSGNPVAYWPMEDAGTTTRAYSPIAGVEPAAVQGVEFASLDSLPSSGPLPKLTALASLSAKVPGTMASGQWQVEFVYNADDKAPDAAGNHQELISFTSPNGTVRRWAILLKKGSALIRGYGAGTDWIVDQGLSVGSDIFHGWVRLRLYAHDLGNGTVDWRLDFQDVGGSAGGFGGNYAGAAGRLSYVTAAWGAATEGWGVGHVTVMDEWGSTLMDGSDDAFHGELAFNRMLRLADEERIPLARIRGELATEAVGYQRQDTILNVLADAAQADGGILREDPRRLGLVYRDRSSLYTQEPALTLSYTAPGLGPELEPVDDDSAVRNDVTVTRDGGTSGRAFLAEGTLSVQAPPYGIGRYDESVTLSLAHDTQPEPVANWRLHLGTYDGARYPTVSVILHKPGADVHVPAVLGLREGDIIRLTNLPAWVAHGDVDLMVEGWTETLDLYRWELQFNCSPGGSWNTAVSDHPVYAMVDTDGSALASPATATDTALAVRSAPGPLWTDAPKETPFDIQMGGEVVRVDAVGRLATTANPYFETDISGWATDNSSITWSQDFVHPRGVGSLKITPNGTSASGGAVGPLSAVGTVTPGLSYRAGAWVYSPTGMTDVQVTAHWYNSAGTYLSTGGLGSGFTIPAGEWVYVESTLVAPANASRARIRPRFGSTPPAQPFYVWAPKLVSLTGQFVNDTFTRSASNGWGVADSGQTWAWTGGASADYAVNGTVGQHVMTSRNTLRYTLASAPSADVDVRTDWALDKTAVADSNYVFLMARYTDTTHLYFARVQVSQTGQAMTLTIRKRNGAEVQVGGSFALGTCTPGTFYTLRLSVIGSTLQAKCWPQGTPEPDVWQITATDTDLTAVGSVGCRSLVGSASTQTLPVTASFDNFTELGSQAFTVTRSLNGVSKAHPAGTPVSLAYPAIASL